MSKESIAHIEEQSPYEMSISVQGNQEILHIKHRDWKENQTFDSHFPIGGVQLFDMETRQPKEFVKTEEIENLYKRFLDEGASYHALVQMHGLRSLIDFFKMPAERQKAMLEVLNAGSSKKDAEMYANMPEQERKKYL